MTLPINLELKFRLDDDVFPTCEDQCNHLWRLAKLLESLSYPVDTWHPPAQTPKERLQLQAFDTGGPTEQMLRRAEEERTNRPNTAAVGVWNGHEGRRGAVFAISYSRTRLCSVTVQLGDVSSALNYVPVANLLEAMLQIWPALTLEVGPFRYLSELQIFPDRPSVGWMLYLPRRIEQEQAPEARMIRHVKDLNGTEGTIIISEIDGPLDADNPEHVKVANALEIRLADQDLLPRYADL